MSALSIAVGVLLGAIAAAAHLAIAFWRARQVTHGRPLAAWLSYPVGLAIVGLALYAAARVAPLAAWTFVLGLFLTRYVVLRRVRGSADGADR